MTCDNTDNYDPVPTGIDVEDEAIIVTGGPFDTLNFVGGGVTATDGGGNIATITIPGGVSVDDEGGPVAGGPFSILNFIGAGVTAANGGGGVANITVPGGVTGGAVSIAQAAGPATLNAGTEGTLDYFASYDDTNSNPGVNPTYSVHSKFGGGWIIRTFGWKFPADAGSTLTSATQSLAVTTAAANDMGQVPLAGATTAMRIQTNPAGTVDINFGFSFRVPACPTTRTLTIYCDHWSSDTTLTCTLADDASVTASSTYTGSHNTLASKKYTVSYSSNSGGDLIVTMNVTANYSTGFPDIAYVAMMCATLA